MIEIRISIGEFLDRISILSIKASRLRSNEAARQARVEYEALHGRLDVIPMDRKTLLEGLERLRDVNEQLWDFENAVRQLENQNQFDEEFIFVSRQIRRLNDKRASIKSEINKLLSSTALDIKEYH